MNITRLLALVALLVSTSSLNAQSTIERLAADGAELRYFKGTTEPPAGWAERTFNENDSWITGHLPVGYGETFMTTPTYTLIEDMANSYLTVYLRVRFEVEDPSRISQLRLQNVQYDDGFVAYINGIEVGRANMPAGPVTSQTAATSHEFTDPQFTRAITDAEALESLVAGTNILAVEVHNTNLGSSDMGFKGFLNAVVTAKPDPVFIRGAQCDGQDDLDLGDPVYLLRWKFGEFYPEPACHKACDMNDDGILDQSDAIFGLQYLFAGGQILPPPYPAADVDPTEDDLTCVSGEPTG